jgi:transposase
MFTHDLHLDALGLQVTAVVRTPSLLAFAVASTVASCPCPTCGALSDRVHSHYVRTIADLPYHDQPVAWRLKVRRFRCVRPDCPRAVFCERLPEVVGTHARTTDRLLLSHRLIGMALGGEAGARLAEHLACPTSPDTLLRRVKQFDGESLPEPRFVGVDDWAWRKGQSYGTILIDLEQGRVIDILPGRDGWALAAWLKDHPRVELITRDRAAAFAQAAREGAPQAKQIADRWHLLKNLREMLERLLGRAAAQVQEALQETPAPAIQTTTTAPEGPVPPAGPEEPTGQSAAPEVLPLPAEAPPLSARREAQRAKRQARAERHQQVRELHRQGMPLREIARTTGLSRNAVRRYCREEAYPAWNMGRRGPSQLDAYATHVDGWLEAGGKNTAELFRQLQGQGYTGSYDAVRRSVNRKAGSTGRPGPRTGTPVVPPVPLPSARQLSFESIRRAEDRKAEEQARMERLRAITGLLPAVLALADEFAAMVRKQTPTTLSEWLSKAEGLGCAELQNFAAGLRQDEAAVAAALTEKWSNGPVEGQVNRLKMIKRQMYGRAGFQLLRARVRFAS